MQSSQHALRRIAGFTMLEALVAVAIMALVVAFAAPSVARYRMRAHARSHAERVMGVLQNAREQAISFGQPVLVLFDDPSAPALSGWPEGVFARIIRSTDGDYAFDDGVDPISDVQVAAGLADEVTAYGLGGTMPYASVPVPGEDESGTTLGGLDAGSSFSPYPPDDPDSPVRGVWFSPQGMALAIDASANPTTPGTGAVYVTDNHSAVYAVVLRALGSVGIRTLDPEALQWK